MKNETVVVLGAGLSGSLMALYLAKRGFKVEVYERRPDMRKIEMSAGKSINLALSVRGLYALKEVGMEKEILDLCISMPGRMVHSLTGDTHFQSYSKDNSKAINSVSRGDLNMRLMDRAEEAGASIHFNQKSIALDWESGEVELKDEVSGKSKKVSGQAIIACDGANSGLRNALLYRARFDYSQTFLTHGYKELTMPSSPDGKHKMETNALHIWPRSHYMLIALPNLDGSYTCTLFLPYEGSPSFKELKTEADVLKFFEAVFPDALTMMAGLEKQYFNNPLGHLVTVRCSPWAFGDKAVLVGDAAHAIVPFYGQGMNAAFEDCTEINRLIGLYENDWAKIFPLYQANRMGNGNAIADLALDNFIEMRDKVGNKDWVFRKELEHALERDFPEHYISRYELVSFSRVPYLEAKQTGEVNLEILMKLSSSLTKPQEYDKQKAQALIENLLGNRVQRWRSSGLLEYK